MQTFSSREAEERLCAVESLLGGTTARLYRKYEYLHDACLQDMVWRFDSRGKLTVALNLFQDYVSPACGLQLRAEGVLACSCDFCSKPPFPVEIYSPVSYTPLRACTARSAAGDLRESTCF